MNSMTSISTIPNTISSVIPSPMISNTPSSILINGKKNDWWPVINEHDILHTSPYTSDAHPPMPATYYISAPPPPAMLSHYRSEQWNPYGYPEFGYPVLPPNGNNNQLGVTSKYIGVALFIGLLTVFAIVQGSLMSVKQKEGIVDVHSRRKRDLSSLIAFENMTPEQQDIFTNDVKVRCIQRTICNENRQLVIDFGPGGIKLAKYLTRSVKKSLENSSGWDRLVEDAAKAGLRGENCNVLYRDCILPATLPTHPQNN
ncbi:hypothetical protein PV328_005845 [Microctonus aethiopoides]|uniref:Uncharacterized protein n=1 Tax=Microctonus aethiopoides TaxID=144406 RepID=A0AA39KSX0_9HYME|nr:hypothetical protein PV328_005845 [Microctonus aethiopoides]